MGGKVRVMLVDDSLVIRGILRKILISDPEVEVVASVGNGKLAIEELEKTQVDAIILDIEMPVMDGTTALPLLLKKKPDLVILVASTLSQKNADISMHCLSLGAKDYVPKPTTAMIAADENSFKRELLEKLKTITKAIRQRTASNLAGAQSSAPKPGINNPTAAGKPDVAFKHYPLRPLPMKRPKALVIGCSTGGPQALAEFFKNKAKPLNVPIFIAQHMPPVFTKSLATHIENLSGLQAREAIDNEEAQINCVYVAPGDYHMKLIKKLDKVIIKLTQEPPENFCRPSVDPLMRTAAEAYGGNVLGLVLTGLGNDGFNGAKNLTDAGGTILTQDESSSVVWGMPGVITKAGLSSGIYNIRDIYRVTSQIFDSINPRSGVKLS